MAERHFLTALIAAILGGGCADGGGDPAIPLAVRDSAGVRIVEFGSADAISTHGIRDRPLVRTGWNDDEPTFSRILCGALTPNGEAVVFDQGSGRLLQIGLDGAIQVIAEQGQGPGELESCDGVEVLADSSWVVYDGMLGRISRFTVDGVFESVGQFRQSGRVEVAPAGVLGSGRLVWIPHSFSPGRMEDDDSEWLMAPLIATGPLGGSPDTIRTVPAVLLDSGDREAGSGSDPFPRYGAGDAFAGGYVWGTNNLPEIYWIDVKGEITQIVRWSSRQQDVDDAVWEEYEAAYFKQMGGSPERGSNSQMSQRLQQQREAASSTLPYYRSLHAHPSGSAWVSEYTYFGLPAQSYLQIDGDGAAAVWIEFPRPIRILAIGPDRVLGVETDEWDVEAVVIYALPD